MRGNWVRRSLPKRSACRGMHRDLPRTQHVRDDSAAFVLRSIRQARHPLFFHELRELRARLLRAIEQQEAASARTGDFPAEDAVFFAHLIVESLRSRNDDVRRKFLLREPVPMRQQAEPIEIAGAYGLADLISDLPNLQQILLNAASRDAKRFGLFAQDISGRSPDVRIIKVGVRGEFVDRVLGQSDPLDPNLSVASDMEFG